MTIMLKVAEAFQNDIGRGIARVDSKAKSSLGVSTGDIIKLSGRKAALAIVWQAHPDDEGLDMVRLDGILRQNVGIGLGETVKVEKAEVKEARKVTLAPKEPIRYGGGFEQYVKKRLIGKPVIKGNALPIGIFGTSIPLVIAQTLPQGPVIINEKTIITIKQEPLKEMGSIPSLTYDDVGGLKDAIQKVREMVELPLRHPEIFERLGVDPPKGVLLYGPPGTGKTLLAKAVANESDANFYYIGGPEIISKYVGESEERLRKLFKEAEENSPSIIFIDELDSVAPKREEVSGEVEKRLVSQLLTLMDGLKARGEIIVIGATNRPMSLDPALRRPGRFDREIEIGVPDKKDRKEVLLIHTRSMPLEKDVDIGEIADTTHGYTGADLSFLTKEAAIKALRRILPAINIEEETISQEILEKLKVSRIDFIDAMREIQPSALREFYVERPSTRWADIGGLTEIKKTIMEAVELPLKNPDIFEKMGIRPIKGVLFYGPPGTGKTLLAKAVANESEANFIAIKGSDLLHRNVGESARLTKELFKKARMASPCIIFIDEIDTVARARSLGNPSVIHEDIINGLLVELDGLSSLKHVVVIAATNRPDILDPALLRAGRFDRVIEIPPPDEKSRVEIFKIHTGKMPLAKDVDLKSLAKMTEGYTGADIENLVREAGMAAIREKGKTVATRHFEQSFKAIFPSIKKDDVESVKKFKTSPIGAMYR
ncbi:MAG: CDC48 family AAA ATPase [Candidatus Micrarchaeota archaeon]